MVPPNIPEHVQQFIRDHIHSVLQLEMLLWLRERGGEWTPETVADELRITPHSAEGRLRDLAMRRLVGFRAQTGEFRYAPETPELSGLVDALAQCYSHTRYSVINLIFAVPGDSARSLADAFLFRKKKGD